MILLQMHLGMCKSHPLGQQEAVKLQGKGMDGGRQTMNFQRQTGDSESKLCPVCVEEVTLAETARRDSKH